MLKAAVVGAGAMGRHHTRILGAMAGVDLGFVVDPDLERANVLASPVGAQAVGNIDELPDLDIAVVATPTESHLEIATALMDRGVSVLVEKPLALDVEQATALVERARDRGVTLAVGHVERFNPVVRFLTSVSIQPRHIHFERLSPFTPRITSNVISDLMVHDLDLACELMGAEPVRIQAATVAVFTDSADIATAILEFPDGSVASLSASRATQDKVRRIEISSADRYIIADCLRQDVQIKRETESEFSQTEPNVYRQASVIEIPYLDRSGEPLTLEVADFVRAVQEGSRPTVDGEAGLRAVRLAIAVEEAAAG